MAAFHPLRKLAWGATVIGMNEHFSVLERVGRLSAASLILAATAFAVGLLWMWNLLPMSSDAGQALMGVLIVLWALVSIAAMFKRPNWFVLIGALLALFVPLLSLGGITLSCAVGDCP